MKKLFQAIRKNEIEIVEQLLNMHPELVNCTAKQPPKKDDGQSPLQVALKTGHLDIAQLLLEHGADVNFMETEPCCNTWKCPVIQDAVTAAVMKCRWNTNNSITGFKVFSTKDEAIHACTILKRMLQSGANINALDSYGNSGLWRYCLQASQILPGYNYSEHRMTTDRILTDDLREDLLQILLYLNESGADYSYISPNTNTTVMDFYKEGPLASILRANELQD